MSLAVARARIARPRPLRDATAYWLASVYDAPNDRLTDLSGNGLHARFGTTVGADASDPVRLVRTLRKHLWLPGLAGNYASVPDSAGLSITSDFDIRIRIAMTDWTPGVQKGLVAKLSAAGDQGYQLAITSTGFLKVAEDVTAFVSSAATGFTDGDAKWLRCAFDANNGAAQREVKFYTAADSDTMPASWNQLGTAVTAAGVSGPIDHSNALSIGATLLGSDSEQVNGKIWRAQVRNNILDDGSGIVLDVDFDDATEPYATFVDDTSQTVTINRAATGLKSSIVDGTLLALGSDFIEVPDSALLDFDTTDPFTLAILFRLYGTTAATTLMGHKLNSTTAPGWMLRRNASLDGEIVIADGTNVSADSIPIPEGRTTLLSGVRRVSADDLEAFKNGVGSGSPTADATTATLANAEVFRIGRSGGGSTSYTHMEFFGAAVWKGRVLSPLELAVLQADLAA